MINILLIFVLHFYQEYYYRFIHSFIHVPLYFIYFVIQNVIFMFYNVDNFHSDFGAVQKVVDRSKSS